MWDFWKLFSERSISPKHTTHATGTPDDSFTKDNTIDYFDFEMFSLSAVLESII